VPFWKNYCKIPENELSLFGFPGFFKPGIYFEWSERSRNVSAPSCLATVEEYASIHFLSNLFLNFVLFIKVFYLSVRELGMLFLR